VMPEAVARGFSHLVYIYFPQIVHSHTMWVGRVDAKAARGGKRREGAEKSCLSTVTHWVFDA
jgi:hypothetical protein